MNTAYLEEYNGALTASELRYRRLFESAKDGILILDADTGYIVDVNPYLINLLGYSHIYFFNKAIWDIGCLKDIVSNINHFQELKEKKYIRYENLPLETCDGQLIDVEFVSNVYSEGSQSVIQCNIRNITERKQAEDILAAERELLTVTLRCISEAVITTDVNGNIVLMNIAAETFTGKNLGDVQGSPVLSLFTIIDQQTRIPIEISIEQSLKTGVSTESDNSAIFILENGSELIITYSIAPIINTTKKTIGAVMVLRDITEKQKLIDTANNMQRLESLSLLAAGVAHDFNNLMCGIYGCIEIAKELSKDVAVVETLTMAVSTIERARALTQQLLTFAKGGSPHRVTGNLLSFFEETTRFALSGTNAVAYFDLPQYLWMCSFDRTQIVQVINNIVINAIQAMPSGGSINVSACNITCDKTSHPTLLPGKYVKLSIRDNGCGIPKEHIGKIFDPFYTTKTTGHGLGLSTCYSIIKKHGGYIDVDSKPGKYTTFHMYLPAFADEEVSVTKATVALHKGIGTFLLMDDEAILRNTIGEMLKSFGYSVICKKNGRELIDFVTAWFTSNQTLAGILLDLTIPDDMGGKEVVEEIQKITVITPVFIMSGYTDDPVIKDPWEYGISASICKPFRKEDLSDLLNKHM